MIVHALMVELDVDRPDYCRVSKKKERNKKEFSPERATFTTLHNLNHPANLLKILLVGF